MSIASIEQFPIELLRRIACYLQSHDVVHLSEVSRHLHDSIRTTRLTLPEPIIHREHWVGDLHSGDIPRRHTAIPVLLRSIVHTVVLRGQFSDQGWGNRKGKLYVIANSPTRCRLVAESALAPRAFDQFKLEFGLIDGETYDLWYSVGGGGGHQLMVKDVTVSFVVFSDHERYLERNFCALVDQGAFQGIQLRWHFRMLQCICQDLVAQLESGDVADENLSAFLNTSGIDVNEESLLALEFIASSMITLGDEVSNNDGTIVWRDITEEHMDVLAVLFPVAVEVLNRIIADSNHFQDQNLLTDNDDWPDVVHDNLFQAHHILLERIGWPDLDDHEMD